MRFMTISGARKQLSSLVGEVDRLVITKGGQPEAVLLSFDEYQALAAAQALASDPANLARIAAAHAEVTGGDLSQTEVFSPTAEEPSDRDPIRRRPAARRRLRRADS